MTELQQNRYDQLLRRVGDLKGPGSKVNDALTELFPMFDVENVPLELLLLSGTRICMGVTATTAGGGAFFGIHLLRNNAGSGVIARLIGVEVLMAAGIVVAGPTQNSGTLSGQRAFVDGRVFGEGTSLVTMADNNSLVQGSNFFQFRTNADLQGRLFPPGGLAVISPGTSFSVGDGLPNVAVVVSWLWTERIAEPSELNL